MKQSSSAGEGASGEGRIARGEPPPAGRPAGVEDGRVSGAPVPGAPPAGPAGLHVVLLEPEIPPNTGNIARLCAATGTTLELVEPLGFRLDDATLRRAGMDYWRHVRWRRWAGWDEFRRAQPGDARLWLVEDGGPRRYDEVRFDRGDHLVFGRETAGLPQDLLAAYGDRWVRIPMFHPESRSLNLANCVALVLFEALRQLGFPGERQPRISRPPAGCVR